MLGKLVSLATRTAFRSAGYLSKKGANLLLMQQEEAFVCDHLGVNLNHLETIPHDASSYLLPSATRHFRSSNDMRRTLLPSQCVSYLVCDSEYFEDWEDIEIQDFQHCFDDIMDVDLDLVRCVETDQVLHFQYTTLDSTVMNRIYLGLDYDEYQTYKLLQKQGYHPNHFINALLDKRVEEVGWQYDFF